MSHPTSNHILCCVVLVAMTLLLTGCPGTQAVAHENWSLVQLLSKGERIESVSEVVEVRNCGLPEKKSVQCSAGTSSSLTVGLGASIIMWAGTIDPSVQAELGFDRTSGQSLDLETPTEGYVAKYAVTKEYRVVAGEVLARSSAGSDQKLAYAFQASCALRLDAKEVLPCDSRAEQLPTLTALPQPTVQPSTPVPPTATVALRPTTQPTAPVQSVSFEVFAAKAWQSTGIRVRVGDLLQVDYVSGQWTGQKPENQQPGDYRSYTGPDNPSGIERDYSCMPMHASVVGQNALIGRIGDGEPFKIGRQFIGTVSSEGPLLLRMNDCDGYLFDNDGSVMVVIRPGR